MGALIYLSAPILNQAGKKFKWMHKKTGENKKNCD